MFSFKKPALPLKKTYIRRVYKCRFCSRVFTGAVIDVNKEPPYDGVVHEHRCSEGMRGIGDQIGFQRVDPNGKELEKDNG